LAVEEDLLDVVRARQLDELPAVTFAGCDVALVADPEAGEEVLELRVLGDRPLEIRVVRLNVDDEVVGLEELARRVGVAGRAVVDREAARALGVAAATREVDRGERRRRAAGRLEEAPARPAERAGALVGHAPHQLLHRALPRGLRERIELAVRDDLGRDRKSALGVLLGLAGGAK